MPEKEEKKKWQEEFGAEKTITAAGTQEPKAGQIEQQQE